MASHFQHESLAEKLEFGRLHVALERPMCFSWFALFEQFAGIVVGIDPKFFGTYQDASQRL